MYKIFLFIDLSNIYNLNNVINLAIFKIKPIFIM